MIVVDINNPKTIEYSISDIDKVKSSKLVITLPNGIMFSYPGSVNTKKNQIEIKISSLENLENIKSTISENEYKLVFEHSNLAADLIQEYEEISTDVVAIVRQHHELPLGKGFPAKITYHKITPLSTVFIVAHDLTEYSMSNVDWTIEKYLLKVRDQFKGVHFHKVIAAIKDM